ncbi:MAG: AMP-binding protein, partial [Xanthobacteraceae bacterium]
MTGLKLSYVHGASEQPLIGQTIGQFFDAVCDKWPARPALVVRHQRVRLSYGELRQQVDRLAAGLLTLGLDPGDRIGIWSPNNSEWVLTQFATAKANSNQRGCRRCARWCSSATAGTPARSASRRFWR